MSIYTIGFTKKTAEVFFNMIKDNNINILVDIRLNNTSQLAGFSKFPDVKYFLKNLSNCEYIHDVRLSPSERTLKDFKAKRINWEEYVIDFNKTLEEREVKKYIEEKYIKYKDKNICLLCSEVKHTECHRSIVSEIFKEIWDKDIINL